MKQKGRKSDPAQTCTGLKREVCKRAKLRTFFTKRWGQEVIEQLKNGVNANAGAYEQLGDSAGLEPEGMYGLLMPNRKRGLEIVRMESASRHRSSANDS